jgi:ParB-like chromosome segregation protein Spo0J
VIAFGCIVPILVDRSGTILAGHGRWLACQLLKRTVIPAIRIEHLSETQARAFMIADNRLRALRLGEFIDTAQIAQRFALSNPHVRRLLRFAYLAPDIVEAIVEGRQTRILTVKLLLKGIPLDWADQRAAFGFR